ncbi:MAG: hypothetical protein JNL40_10410 [Cyclobacteriaceae bacterium]|nr:hypothetical protein [Cyclobacteriaceae bacterium]
MRLLLAFVLVSLSQVAVGQMDSTLRYDTAIVDRAFSELPGMVKKPEKQSGHSQVHVMLKDNATFGLGISVYNASRGRVPGMQIDPYYQVDTLTWRTNSPLVVLDGVVFNQSIGSYYNLNAFEYSDMRMILSRNGAIAYGGGGGNRGAIVLQSRSGEGLLKPTFDFNTTTTYAWTENDHFPVSHWNLSNSLGYAQDFGKLDLRLSTNYTVQPPGDAGIKGPSFWRLKANVGYTLPRFTARLILAGNEGWLINPNHSPQGSSDSRAQNDLLQGNLMMSYKLSNWLSLSGQFSRTKVSDVQSFNSVSYTQSTNHDNRLDAGNLLLHAKTRISKAFTLSGSAGWVANSTYSQSRGLSYEVTTHSILATTYIGFREKLFLEYVFRRDMVDYYFLSDAFNAYSFSGSYLFNHLIDPSGKVLSFSKIRASYGDNDCQLDTSVPRVGADYPYPGVQRSSAVEAGLEVGFLKGRIQLMGNYFKNKSYTPGPMAPPVDPVTGYTVTYYSVYYNTIVDGFEFLARMKIVEGKKFGLTTQLIAGWNKTSLERVSGSFFSGGHWPSATPDWIGGWLNQVTAGRFSFSMLIDVSMGGSVLGTTPGANNFHFFDKSFVKIREFSVGYNLSLSTRMKGFVSLSLRNPVTLYSNSDLDFETFTLNNYAGLGKSASVSFSLEF